MFESIENTAKRLEMTSLLASILGQTPKEEIGKVVYMLQGKLHPDYMGVELGVAEKLFMRTIADVTGKSVESVEVEYKKAGDLGTTVEKLLRKKTQTALFGKPLTVDTVYGTLDKIAHASGSGSAETKMRLLTSLLNDATPLEGRYLARIAIGSLRLGVADMTLLDALAVAYGGGKEARGPIEHAYNISSDLGCVAEAICNGGVDGVKKFKITLGRPVRPMLCERLPSATEILEKMENQAAVEYKYDGLRIQAHVNSTKVHLFSRRLEDITSQFPDVTKKLQKALRIREAILDGECVAVDPQTGDMLPFQVVSQRRGRKYELQKTTEEVPVTVYLFDILYADGRDMLSVPYPERRKVLKEAVVQSDHVVIGDQFSVAKPEDLETLMSQAVASGCEGLVIKNTAAQSTYQAGGRGFLWIKYKRSYKAEVQDTFDLVPVGAFAGRGKRAGGYGALLMAAYNKDRDTFETLCKLGSGFTDDDVVNLPKILAEHKIEHHHPRVYSIMEPDVWLTPSLVLEVAADEITLSPLHTCSRDLVRKNSGMALRFPRFTGNWRRDKAPEDATTSQETFEMYKKQLKQIEADD